MIRKTITYSSFILISFLIVVAFITAKTYTQLGVAVVLYPLLAYFALRMFPRKYWKKPLVSITVPLAATQKSSGETVQLEKERVEIADIDKRVFLKLIGAAGIYFFLSSLFSRRGEAIFFDRVVSNGGVTKLTDPEGNTIHPAEHHPTDGYQISEIDDRDITFFGYTNKTGNWYIMKGDPENGSFRYTKGDSGFPGNWADREHLNYVYYHELFGTH